MILWERAVKVLFRNAFCDAFEGLVLGVGWLSAYKLQWLICF